MTISKPVTGVCNYCRAVVGIDCLWTEFHHDDNRYDKEHPLRYTIEICPRYHGKETWILEPLKHLRSESLIIMQSYLILKEE